VARVAVDPGSRKSGDLRSFVFPRVNTARAGSQLNDGVLSLSRIGAMPVVMHRPLPEGFHPEAMHHRQES
jgi:putative transposase